MNKKSKKEDVKAEPKPNRATCPTGEPGRPVDADDGDLQKPGGAHTQTSGGHRRG
ncbi:hypothetical protein [Psychromonas aquimarina]|uniref:hypothetical protein n=1 Tax=Psychromonas aquimarina TaxID=444919 RepID=UPI0012F75396|nr:hypothetical protein [Psychromonas aquimarina]